MAGKRVPNVAVQIEGRLRYEHVFQKSSGGGGKEKDGKPAKLQYSATVIFAKDGKQHKKLLTAMEEAAELKWPDGWEKKLAACIRKDDSCLHDGSDKEGVDGFSDDVMFVSAKNSNRPATLDQDLNPVSEEDGVIYAGCKVVVDLDIWAMDDPEFGIGVYARLCGVQYAGRGEAFSGGRISTRDNFKPIAVDDDDEDERPRRRRSSMDDLK